MAREAKLVIATEDKTKAGIASAKAGMGQLVEAAKESKRQLEGINAVLQLGGWTMMASKAVGALRDITKEARENSEAFKESTKAFDDLRKELGSSLVSAVEPMVSAIGKIADQWAAASRTYREYRDAVKKDAEDRTLQDNVAIARGNLANIGEQLAKARAGAGTMGFSQLLVDKLVADYKLAEQQLRTAQERLNPRTVSGSGGGGASYPVQQVDGGLQVGTGNVPGFFQEWSLANLLGDQTLTRFMEAAADAIVTALEDASQGSLGQSDNLSEAALILAPERGGGMGAMFDMSPLALLADLVSPLAKGFSEMFMALEPIVQLGDPLKLVLQGMFEVIGPLITEALAPLIGILKIVGNVLGQVLAPVIKVLGDAIKWVAEGLIAVINGVIRAINWALGWAKVNIAEVSLQSATSAGMATMPSGGGTGAAYTGSQPITFNFYNQGNVVGSGGLEELAAIIEGLIQRRARYA